LRNFAIYVTVLGKRYPVYGYELLNTGDNSKIHVTGNVLLKGEKQHFS